MMVVGYHKGFMRAVVSEAVARHNQMLKEESGGISLFRSRKQILAKKMTNPGRHVPSGFLRGDIRQVMFIPA